MQQPSQRKPSEYRGQWRNDRRDIKNVKSWCILNVLLRLNIISYKNLLHFAVLSSYVKHDLLQARMVFKRHTYYVFLRSLFAFASA